MLVQSVMITLTIGVVLIPEMKINEVTCAWCDSNLGYCDISHVDNNTYQNSIDSVGYVKIILFIRILGTWEIIYIGPPLDGTENHEF